MVEWEAGGKHRGTTDFIEWHCGVSRNLIETKNVKLVYLRVAAQTRKQWTRHSPGGAQRIFESITFDSSSIIYQPFESSAFSASSMRAVSVSVFMGHLNIVRAIMTSLCSLVFEESIEHRHHGQIDSLWILKYAWIRFTIIFHVTQWVLHHRPRFLAAHPTLVDRKYCALVCSAAHSAAIIIIVPREGARLIAGSSFLRRSHCVRSCRANTILSDEREDVQKPHRWHFGSFVRPFTQKTIFFFFIFFHFAELGEWKSINNEPIYSDFKYPTFIIVIIVGNSRKDKNEKIK